VRKQDFKQEDLSEAIDEKRCIYTCLARVEESMNLGNFNEAKQCLVDALNSVQSIENMKRKADKQNIVRSVG